MNNLDTAACPGSLLGLYSDTYSQTSISSNLDSQIEYELLIGDQYEAFVGFISEFFIFGGSYCGLATEAHSLTICLGTEPDYLISSKGDSCQSIKVLQPIKILIIIDEELILRYFVKF